MNDPHPSTTDHHPSLEEIRPRLQAISDEILARQRHLAQDLNLEESATKLQRLGRLMGEPAVRARFLSLPLAEFNHANLDLLEPAATAILHLNEQLRDAPAAQLPSLQRELSGAWTILSEAYAEVHAAARFLFRHEAELLDQFGEPGDL